LIVGHAVGSNKNSPKARAKKKKLNPKHGHPSQVGLFLMVTGWPIGNGEITDRFGRGTIFFARAFWGGFGVGFGSILNHFPILKNRGKWLLVICNRNCNQKNGYGY
jgi:hypothetical protein